MTPFSLNEHRANDEVLRLAVAGEVDLQTSERLADAITDAIATRHVAHLVVDLDQVTFLDSTGIAALVAGHNLANKHGVTYHVDNPHGMVERTLDITGVLHTLTRTDLTAT